MATGSAWKLPPDSTSPSSAKTSGIVRDGIRFDAQDFGGMAQLIETGAHDLGLAAHRIGILHALAVEM